MIMSSGVEKSKTYTHNNVSVLSTEDDWLLGLVFCVTGNRPQTNEEVGHGLDARCLLSLLPKGKELLMLNIDWLR